MLFCSQLIFSLNLAMLINKLVRHVVLKSLYYLHLEKKRNYLNP